MSADRIVSWAAALLLCVPAIATAQTPDPAPDQSGSAEEEERSPTTEDEGAPPLEESDEEDEEDDETLPATGGTPISRPVTSDETVDETIVEEKSDLEASQPLPEPVVEREIPTARVERRPRIFSAWNHEQSELPGKDYLWRLGIGGYIRAGYTGIQNDPAGTFGTHDGFGIGNARLTLEGTLSTLGFKLQLDGAVERNDDANDPNAEVATKLRDATIFWQPFKPLRLTVGQFKPPFDVEEQFSTSEILFANRSVVSRGVHNIEGRNVRGLATDREVGVMLGTDHWHFLADDDEPEGPGVSYGLALTNGQDANRALNDNDKLAGYGRLELHWADLVTVGGAYFINDRTIGVEPDTLDENRSGWTADLTLTGYGLTLIGGLISETTTRPDLEGVDPETSGFGYQAQLAYREPFFGFQPAFRYAQFDPTEIADDSDALTYLTFGLNYVPDYPVRLLVNYTIAQETEEFEIPNNRFDAVLQVTW